MKNHPLYKQIQMKIKEQIRLGLLRPGDRVSSEKELAKQFYVSQITSRNALIGLVEEGIVVRVKGKGSFIKKDVLKNANITENARNKGTIGVILPCMKTNVDQRILDGIEKHVCQSGYHLMIRITRESQLEETDAIEMFLEVGVKGLVIFPTEKENNNESILRLSQDKFPLVLIDRFIKEIRTYSVSSD
ncbi:MAG TPA: GntR family transcriptional regulator, partial [Bacilli bacterium]